MCVKTKKINHNGLEATTGSGGYTTMPVLVTSDGWYICMPGVAGVAGVSSPLEQVLMGEAPQCHL